MGTCIAQCYYDGDARSLGLLKHEGHVVVKACTHRLLAKHSNILYVYERKGILLLIHKTFINEVLIYYCDREVKIFRHYCNTTNILLSVHMIKPFCCNHKLLYAACQAIVNVH